MSLSRDIVREFFDYKEGALYWKVNRGSQQCKGKPAGTPHSKGYIAIKLNGTVYKAHRLIYIWHFGHLPSKVHIDHINCIRNDNRIENLRKVTPQENQWNRKNVKGFSVLPSGKFRVRICINNKDIHIGVFDTEEEAKMAYQQAKKEFHSINKYSKGA